MRIGKRQISILFVVFVLAAGGLVCSMVFNRAALTEQLIDKDVLAKKLEKTFFYSEFLREQGKTKQADETLKLWDYSPAFREYRSLDMSAAAELVFALTG